MPRSDPRPLCLLAAAALAGCPAPKAPPQATPRPQPAVVTASPALAEMICAIGAQEHLLGVSRYCVFPQSLSALPRIGGVFDPNLEAIDALSPDLVLTQHESPKILALAERRPYTVENFRIETIADVHSALERLGVILRREGGAAAEVTRLRTAVERARAKAPGTVVRTLVVYGHQAGSLGQVSSPGSGTFVSECLAAAGGQNVLEGLKADAWHTVAKEVLVDKAPDLIIELSSEPIDAVTAKRLRDDWSVLGNIPAVARGQIAIVCGSGVLIPGTRLDELVDGLSRAVRGELDVQ